MSSAAVASEPARIAPASESNAAMIFNGLCRMELFSFQPTPRFHKGSYGTFVGVICTLLVLFGTTAYMSVTIVRFLEDNVSISLETTSSPSRGMPMLPMILELPFIGNKSFFDVSIQHRFSPRPGQRTERVEVNYTIESAGRIFVPMDGSQNLTGNCRIGSCHYVRLKVFPCENGTTRLPPGVVCRSIEEIGQVLDSNYMDMTLFFSMRGEVVPYTTQMSLKNAVSFRKQLIFDIKEVILKPNFYNTFVQSEYLELQLSRETFDIDRLPRLLLGDDREFSKIDFALSSTVIRENINPQTLLDLVGTWAAFYGALMAIFKLFVSMYNRERFYLDFPAWDRFNNDFVRADPQPTTAPAGDVRVGPAKGSDESIESAPQAVSRKYTAPPPPPPLTQFGVVPVSQRAQSERDHWSITSSGGIDSAAATVDDVEPRRGLAVPRATPRVAPNSGFGPGAQALPLVSMDVVREQQKLDVIEAGAISVSAVPHERPANPFPAFPPPHRNVVAASPEVRRRSTSREGDEPVPIAPITARRPGGDESAEFRAAWRM